jgi:hypothetical protein
VWALTDLHGRQKSSTVLPTRHFSVKSPDGLFEILYEGTKRLEDYVATHGRTLDRLEVTLQRGHLGREKASNR